MVSGANLLSIVGGLEDETWRGGVFGSHLHKTTTDLGETFSVFTRQFRSCHDLSLPLLCGMLGVVVSAVGFMIHYHPSHPMKWLHSDGLTDHIVHSEGKVLEQGISVSNDCLATQLDDIGRCTASATAQTKKRLPLSYDPMCGPIPRIGCAMAIDNSSGVVMIGGGLGAEINSTGVIAYSSCTDTWITLSESGICLMYARMAVSSNSRLYLIGGVDDKAEASSAVYGFDFDGNEWVLSDIVSTHRPPGRFNFSLTKVCEDHFVLFGGRGSDGILFNDIWSMKISESGLITWERLDEHCSLPVPTSREAHATVVMNDLMLLFGGCSDDEGDYDNNIISAFDMKTGEWVLKDTVGDVPARSCLVGGSAHHLGEGSDIILVIAGIPEVNDSDSYVSGTFNALFTLDVSMEPYVWARVSAEWVGGGDLTVPPTSRSFYGSALDTDSGLLYIFGGLDNVAKEVVAMGGLCILDCSRLISSVETAGEDDHGSDDAGQEACGEHFICNSSNVLEDYCNTGTIDFADNGRDMIEWESTARESGTRSVAPLACPAKP